MHRRPTLADHIAARRHRVAGASFVTLHDDRSGRVAKIGLREWAVLRCADGTRDLDGIALSLRLQGFTVARAEIRQFLQQLDGAGMLSTAAIAEPDDREADERAVVALPDFTLRCDGSGSCCRIYPSTMFTPEEAAAVGAPFTPARGSASTAWGAQAVDMIDGRCSFLDDALRCRLHADGRKPHGCSVFPAVWVDDGESLRVGPAPECACVFASIGVRDGAPLHDGTIDPRTYIAELPARIDITTAVSWSRQEYLAWSDAVTIEGDVAAGMWALADELAGSPGSWEIERGALETLLERRLALHAYRAPGDYALTVPAMMLDGLSRDAAEPHQEAEAFYWRALLHIHTLALDAPIVSSLRKRALRVVIARTMEVDHPLALVEAYARGFHL